MLQVAGTSLILSTSLFVQGDSFSTSAVGHVQHSTPTGMTDTHRHTTSKQNTLLQVSKRLTNFTDKQKNCGVIQEGKKNKSFSGKPLFQC